jgi:hypothetical protein
MTNTNPTNTTPQSEKIAAAIAAAPVSIEQAVRILAAASYQVTGARIRTAIDDGVIPEDCLSRTGFIKPKLITGKLPDVADALHVKRPAQNDTNGTADLGVVL